MENDRCTDYFLKMIDALKFPGVTARFQASLPVLDILCSQHGITNIARPIPTTAGNYAFQYNNYICALYECIDGTQTYEYDIQKYADLLAEIHSIDGGELDAAKETAEIPYASEFQEYMCMLGEKPAADSIIAEARAYLLPKKDEIQTDWQALQEMQRRVQSTFDPNKFKVTHSDGPGNIIRKGDELYLIDWDDLKLAPVERDIWIHVGNPSNAAVNRRFMSRYKKHFPDYEVDENWFRFYLYWKHFEYMTISLRVIFDPDFSYRRNRAINNLKEGYSWTRSVIRNLDSRC